MANKLSGISFKIESDTKEQYVKICKKRYSSISRELQIHIYKTIENEKLNNQDKND